MLESLETAQDPAELPPLLQVGDRRLQAPARHAELLRGQQRRAHLERAPDGGVRVGEHDLARRAVEGDIGELTRHVQ